MHHDLFGKFEEFEQSQSIENECFQLNDSTLFDSKEGRIYFTDELGRTGSLILTNGGRIINDLVEHNQIKTAVDVLDLIQTMEIDLVEN